LIVKVRSVLLCFADKLFTTYFLNHPKPLFDYGVLRNKRRGTYIIGFPPLSVFNHPKPLFEEEGLSPVSIQCPPLFQRGGLRGWFKIKSGFSHKQDILPLRGSCSNVVGGCWWQTPPIPAPRHFIISSWAERTPFSDHDLVKTQTTDLIT